MTPRLYTVFETVDHARREVYVGLATEEWLLERRIPCAELRHIEHDMPEELAREFIRHYVATALPRGWRFRCAPP